MAAAFPPGVPVRGGLRAGRASCARGLDREGRGQGGGSARRSDDLPPAGRMGFQPGTLPAGVTFQASGHPATPVCSHAVGNAHGPAGATICPQAFVPAWVDVPLDPCRAGPSRLVLRPYRPVRDVGSAPFLFGVEDSRARSVLYRVIFLLETGVRVFRNFPNLPFF